LGQPVGSKLVESASSCAQIENSLVQNWHTARNLSEVKSVDAGRISL
jgi:hypothetical protein